MVNSLSGDIFKLVFHKVLYWVLSYILLYINDLIDGMKSNMRIFADDTSLFVVVDDPNTVYLLKY